MRTRKSGIKKIEENKHAYTFSEKLNENIFDYFSVDTIIRDYDGQKVVRISYKKNKTKNCLIDLPVIFDERLEYTEIPNFKEDTYKIIIQTWIVGFISAFGEKQRNYFEKFLQEKLPEYDGTEWKNFYISQQVVFDSLQEGFNYELLKEREG